MKKVVTTMLCVHVAFIVVFGLAAYRAEAEQITLTLSNPWATVTDGNTIAFKRTVEKFEKAYRLRKKSCQHHPLEECRKLLRLELHLLKSRLHYQALRVIYLLISAQRC